METNNKNRALRFVAVFLVLFLLFYYGNKFYFSLTIPGKRYNEWLAQHLNYIAGLRHLLLGYSKWFLELIGFTALTNDQELMVVGRNTLKVVYTCLGLGVLSFFAAFVIAYPKPWKPKLIFLIVGMISIQVLNVCRLILLVLYWSPRNQRVIDHHTIFNILIYIIIAISLYFWVKEKKSPQTTPDGKN